MPTFYHQCTNDKLKTYLFAIGKGVLTSNMKDHGYRSNWLPWQRPLRYRKSRSRSIICTQNTFIRWKDCENRSRGSWDNLSPN